MKRLAMMARLIRTHHHTPPPPMRQDKELARQLVELGYRGSGEPLKREEFEHRKRAADHLRLAKQATTQVLASAGKGLEGYPLLQALAEREEANRSGRLSVGLG